MQRIVVMGVSGCGKSTLAAALADALGCAWIEGDQYHSAQSQQKMRSGIPLDDSDREPWLARLGALMAAHDGDVVLSCSALKRTYRDRLRAAVPGLVFVHLQIDEATASQRVAARPAHLFPQTLVATQFQTLESPAGEPGVLQVAATWPIDAQVETVRRWLAA